MHPPLIDQVPALDEVEAVDPPTESASPPLLSRWRRFGGRVLIYSVLAHVIFGVVATYLIVQTIATKRKQNFAGQPAAAPTHAVEHHIQMQKKQQTMSAPAPMKRITTTSNVKVALPAMPAMPRTDTAVKPLSMAGSGGLGTSLSMGGASGGTGG